MFQRLLSPTRNFDWIRNARLKAIYSKYTRDILIRQSEFEKTSNLKADRVNTCPVLNGRYASHIHALRRKKRIHTRALRAKKKRIRTRALCAWKHDENEEFEAVRKLNDKELNRLKRIRKNVDWEVEDERREFIRDIHLLIENKKTGIAVLRGLFKNSEIEILLSDSIYFMKKSNNPGKTFLDFVSRSGYNDEPKVDEDGEPLSHRTTALHVAARQSYISDNVLRKFFTIYNKFNVNYTDESDLTHFHVACERGFLDVIQKFLELGLDTNRVARETGIPPLNLALINAERDVVELLLTKGADPYLANKEGRSSLHIICLSGDSDDLATMLFEHSHEKYHPMQLDSRDKLGNTPLHFAVMNNRRRMIEFLLRSGADPNSANEEESTALHIISKRDEDDDSMHRFFEINDDIQATIQVNAPDKFGNTPLHLAISRGHRALTELLLRRESDPNLPNEEGSTALHMICKRDKDDGFVERFFEIIGEFEKTVEIDAVDKLGNSPLHLALRFNNNQVAELLIKTGADPTVANEEGLTPLHIICERYHDDGLIDRFFKIIEEVKLSVQVDVVDKSGRTPLQLAVMNVLPSAVEVLLNRGADHLLIFVFLSERFRPSLCQNKIVLQLRVVSGLLVIVKHLERRGYELDSREAMTIMSSFADYGLFESLSDDFKQRLNSDETFQSRMKEIKMGAELSVYDVIRLSPKQAAKLVTYEDYSKLARSHNWRNLPQMELVKVCIAHLCEKMSRGFFRRCARDPMGVLLHHRLPDLCCDKINDYLRNEDLYKICLLNTDQSSLVETGHVREVTASLRGYFQNFLNKSKVVFNSHHDHDAKVRLVLDIIYTFSRFGAI
ncbi:unnamed protein product [Trichogramma brassicae]|uniref:Uncharacterized protein n=1 Tax=Trichogramma brassicae TaxID=86971 RepID=A0A6H5HUV1_9HYME|nr:unnamed protein product [Trichogramma brassicae]